MMRRIGIFICLSLAVAHANTLQENTLKANLEEHTATDSETKTNAIEPQAGALAEHTESAQSVDSVNADSINHTQNIKEDVKENAKDNKSQEVYVDEGVIFMLDKDDADFNLYGQSYALLPRSVALKNFLNQQKSALDARTLRSSDNTTKIYNQGKEILFYYSSNGGSNLYAKIAPKRYKLTLEEFNDESKEPHEIVHIYRIQNFSKDILDAPCFIVQTRQFIRDRMRSEMLINLDRKINPKLLTQGQIELFLECSLPQNEEIF
ncbi:hypothetical protein [Helicobacter jaachi]|nr:hypothetical protein [Helicobacter jaachi]